MTKKKQFTNKDISAWLQKNVAAKIERSEEDFESEKKHVMAEALKFLCNMKTWEQVKSAYHKTATIYSKGWIEAKDVRTILDLLNSYADIIERKELKVLQEEYLILLDEYKKLQEILQNDNER